MDEREKEGRSRKRKGECERGGKNRGRIGAVGVCEILGAGPEGGRATDQHFPQAWAQACETTNVLKNLNWDLLRTNAVMC